jgi:hypothetical protein
MSQVKGENVNRLIAVVASCIIVFGGGIAVGTQFHHNAPICIQINSDGNPAPSSCANPNSYQVNSYVIPKQTPCKADAGGFCRGDVYMAS